MIGGVKEVIPMRTSFSLTRLITRALGRVVPEKVAPGSPPHNEPKRLDCGWERYVEDRGEAIKAGGSPARDSGAKLLPALLLLLAAGCAARDDAPTIAEGESHDPIESANRVVFDGNLFVDRTVVRPVARAYREQVPQRVRSSVGNFARNLGEPQTLVNDLLQANTTRAWNTTQRFVVNTTVGVAGLFDVAADLGLPHHNADFGQTLGVWGVGPGPVTQLPIMGHSNLRDTVGTVAGFFGDPLGYVPGAGTVLAAGKGVGLMDMRARILPQTDALEASSVDFYAAVRSVREQQRAALVEEGRQGRVRDR